MDEPGKLREEGKGKVSRKEVSSSKCHEGGGGAVEEEVEVGEGEGNKGDRRGTERGTGSANVREDESK